VRSLARRSDEPGSDQLASTSQGFQLLLHVLTDDMPPE
jgi:hypothetical protein